MCIRGKRQKISTIPALFRAISWLRFEGTNGFTDSHDTVQGMLGNATWLNEYEPRGEDRIAEVMLWLCLSMGLCCTIVGEYPKYRAAKLASRPKSLVLYIARPKTWFTEIAVLLQEQPTPQFELGVWSLKQFQNGPCLVNR